MTASTGDNPFLKHGFVRASANGRHFEHANGTPFFWLGDTWWKCLCKRMTWEGFKELTADRKVYDWTTWKEGMNYPGATQLGIGKKLLEQYPWWRFEPHPEWAPGCFAAGAIP